MITFLLFVIACAVAPRFMGALLGLGFWAVVSIAVGVLIFLP